MLGRGDKIGGYILLEKIGSGGFGDVWKAEKRTVLDVNYFALKFFRPKDNGVDVESIGKEMAVWKRLKGLPHIISVIELDQFEDYIYVVSDYADGGSLEKWLKNNDNKASSEAEAVSITLQILTGLENLHEKGFIHRDLKPDNILLMNGKFCLADFGVSREMKTHSKATGTAGTMEYMPPEAFAAKPSITPQTDIWAVGVILQRLLTGSLPYPQEDQPSLIAAILMSEPEHMPESVSESLREIVKKALQKQRENRFQSAQEMHEALKNPKDFLNTFTGTKINPAPILLDENFRQNSAEVSNETEVLTLEPTQDWREFETQKLSEKSQETKLAVEVQTQQPESKNFNSDLTIETQPKGISFLWFAVVGVVITGFVVICAILDKPNFFNNPSTTNKTNTLNNSIGMEFVKIPAGSFMMGSPGSEKNRDDDEFQHKVTISKTFYMGKYEVTQAQWKAVLGKNPSSFSSCGDNCPVEMVSWDDVQEFIKKLNAKGEGTYRLPTEAEWEYVCRAGITDAYSEGDFDQIAWYDKNSGNKTNQVGQKKANAFGLYDMHGNVWEWTADWYGTYSSLEQTDPKPTSGSNRVIRGGSWNNSIVYIRSANRDYDVPTSRINNLGFRLVRE